MKYNSINITLNNSKLGGFIPSLDLPPVVTCRKGAPCIKNCYARHGAFLYPSKVASMQSNLDAFNADQNAFFNDIISFLNNRDIAFRFWRWFGAGDIVNADFFNGCVYVAQQCPETRFLMFTKKFEIVNDFIKNGGVIPSNLRVVFSGWDKTFKINNPYKLPCAYVELKDKNKCANIPEFAIPCEGSCATCKACWSLQKAQSVYFKQH